MNKYQPHVLVLPEDDANRQLAVGFHLEIDQIRQMKVVEVAGGWRKVLDAFVSIHIEEMERTTNRFIVLLIDFDEDARRLDEAKAVIPAHLIERVFVLGVWSEPEKLERSPEDTGSALAKDCRNGTSDTWDEALLKHNADEVARLRERLRPILFS